MTGLSILHGCFNCQQYETCRSSIDKEKGIDPKEIQFGKNHTPYRAGCCCQDYILEKVKVEFT